MKVYVLEIEGEFGQMEIDSIYYNKQDAIDAIKDYELEDDEWRITERNVYWFICP